MKKLILNNSQNQEYLTLNNRLPQRKNKQYSCGRRTKHCVKSVRIRSFSGPSFPAFGSNMERYGVFIRSYFECGEIRSRKTLNTNTFHAVK